MSESGEDRLLDQVDTWLSSHSHTREAEPTLQLHKCAEWLARLCARVRQLEAERDARYWRCPTCGETAHAKCGKCGEEFFTYGQSLAATNEHYAKEVRELRAASQRLTEALEKQCRAHAEVCPSHENCAVLQESRKLLTELGAGAPPEDAR